MCSLQNHEFFFQEVSLYLSPLRRQKSSAPLAVFTIPALSTTWNRLAVQVGFSTLTWTSPGLPGGRWPRSSLPQLSGGRLDQHRQAPGVNIRWTFSLKSQLIIALWYCSSHCPRCCIPNNSIKMFISESGVWPSLIALHRTGGTSHFSQTKKD